MNNASKYNPQIHHRRSIRLKGYDYSQPGSYFITMCCEKMKWRFGKIVNQQVILNQYGVIAHNEWERLQERFPNCSMDVFVIMPNHMHGIITLTNVVGVGSGFTPDPNNDSNFENDKKEYLNENDNGAGVNPARTDSVGVNPARTVSVGVNPAPAVSDIVGAYKSITSNFCLEIYKSKNERMGKLWQRDYYEHIIRDERAYRNISAYIRNNPSKW